MRDCEKKSMHDQVNKSLDAAEESGAQALLVTGALALFWEKLPHGTCPASNLPSATFRFYCWSVLDFNRFNHGQLTCHHQQAETSNIKVMDVSFATAWTFSCLEGNDFTTGMSPWRTGEGNWGTCCQGTSLPMRASPLRFKRMPRSSCVVTCQEAHVRYQCVPVFRWCILRHFVC